MICILTFVTLSELSRRLAVVTAKSPTTRSIARPLGDSYVLN